MAPRNRTFKNRLYKCEACGTQQVKLGWDYDVFSCCGQSMNEYLPPVQKATAVIGDDIPGGIMVRHGLCNEDGSPKRYDSKSSIHKAAKARGLVADYTSNWG